MNTSNEYGNIRFAEIKDLKYIVSLSKTENNCLGFIPKIAYEAAITGIKTGKRWSDVCNDKLWVCECNNDLVGFVLASFGRVGSVWKIGKVAQICLQTDARMMKRGQLLLDTVIDYGSKKGTLSFSCGCADDLPSNIFWQTMGWHKIGQRYGISHKNTWKQTSKRKVNIYRYDPYDLFLQTHKINNTK
tara:strand:+ start:3495 stop:4058 length:564 start_codon:yes stop_codon:yes gene_type:complete